MPYETSAFPITYSFKNQNGPEVSGLKQYSREDFALDVLMQATTNPAVPGESEGYVLTIDGGDLRWLPTSGAAGTISVNNYSLYGKAGTDVASSITMGENSVLVRQSGNITALTIPNNTVLLRSGAGLTTLAASPSTFLGMSSTGDLGFISWSEIFSPMPIIDHGTLAGLLDNDHPQYQLSATNYLSSLLDYSGVPEIGQILVYNGDYFVASSVSLGSSPTIPGGSVTQVQFYGPSNQFSGISDVAIVDNRLRISNAAIDFNAVAADPPIDDETPAVWIDVYVGGNLYKIAGYQ